MMLIGTRNHKNIIAMNNYQKKRLMASAGILFFTYLIIHMLVNLNFLTGSDNFNNFYRWFHEAIILRWSVIGLLILGILFHVFTAVSRQLDSNSKRSITYKKPYPKAVPRLVAWGGASILFCFIVFHFFQMQGLETQDFYQEVHAIFTNPIMLLIYALGFTTLAAHLHHALNNVGQTFGLKQKHHQGLALALVIFLVGGFVLIPINVLLF